MDGTGQYPQHVATMGGAASPARRLRLLAAGCAGAAGLLVLVGSFLPLYTVTATLDGAPISLSITSWGFDVTIRERYGTVPISGYLLVVATVSLAAATASCCLAAARAATPGTSRTAGLVTVAAAAFATGVVPAIGMEVIAHAGVFQVPRGAAPEAAASFREGPGAGLWLLMAGVVTALVAVVLFLRSTRSPRVPRRAEPATPRLGFPMPYQGPPFVPPPPGSPPAPPVPPIGRA